MLPSIACFEGVDASDLIVSSRGTSAINLNFNAWDLGRANQVRLPSAYAPNWPFPSARTAAALPTPRVNIRSHTNAGNGPRGTLYNNDLFRNRGIGSGDHTPHDFRLSVNAASDPAEPPPAPPTGLNPLVDKGLHLAGAANMTFGNGTVITRPPGLALDAEDFATLHAWDWDADGFGNPRIHDRSDYPSTDYDYIDLGADEMGDLVMAGYIDGTRIFSGDVPNAVGITDHTQVWFVNQIGAVNYLRPHYNTWIGRGYLWWPHAQGSPDGSGGTNYTGGVLGPPASLRASFTSLLPLFMRSLECDISAHLYLDPHPLWGAAFQVRDPFTVADIYATNAWFDTAPPTLPGVFDNPMVYYNPPPGYPLHGNLGSPPSVWWPFFPQVSAVLIGMPNPPGTAANMTPTYLLTAQPTNVFGPFAPCSGSSATQYTVDAWGMGDMAAACPDVVPPIIGYEGHGIRFNCEVGPGASNLQTFLGIVAVMPGGNRQAVERSRLPASATLDQMREQMRRSVELLTR